MCKIMRTRLTRPGSAESTEEAVQIDISGGEIGDRADRKGGGILARHPELENNKRSLKRLVEAQLNFP